MSISPADLARKTGISRTYAWQILKGRRTPSVDLALQIHQATGLQLGRLVGLTESEIEVMRKVAA